MQTPRKTTINRFIAEHNDIEAKLFVWHAHPGEIIVAINRGAKYWIQFTRYAGSKFTLANADN